MPLAILKENRLKIISALCVSGDGFMGLAGATGLYHIGKNPADLLLTAGAALGFLGHLPLLLWGKGGRGKEQGARGGGHTPVYLRPLFIRRYPLDTGFALWLLAALPYLASGVISGNPPLILSGSIWIVAALFGWLWPEEKKFHGLRSTQVCACLYQISGFSVLLSGLWAHSVCMTAAGCCLLAANFILYTVRKENQSRHTIEQGSMP